MNRISQFNARALAALMLLLAVAVAYLPALRGGFVFDDFDYVVDNRHVATGLSTANVRWAFTSFHSANWHPLTWLSHQADVSIFGLSPSGHHLTNLCLHLLNTMLVLLLLSRATGRFWPAWLAAALFGLHPQRVESVAWIAERKDLLAACFWLLSIAAYARWAKRRGASSYILALVIFALALMAKPMPLTMPAILVLLDFWPLGRVDQARRRDPRGRAFLGYPLALIPDKLPFALLSATSAAITFAAQRSFGAVADTSYISLAARLDNALVAYLKYPFQAAWPSGLAAFYPRRATLPLPETVGLAIILLGLTAVLLAAGRRRPWLAAGWIWYLVTLLPVIGLIQVGDQGMADRYTYLPLLGLFTAVAWGLDELRCKIPWPAAALSVPVALLLLAFGSITTRQTGYWRNDVTLFQRAAAAVPGNWFAENALGVALVAEGKEQEAITHFQAALKIKPDYFAAYHYLGNSQLALSRCAEAVASFRAALALRPNDAEVWNRLGNALSCQEMHAEAVEAYRRALAVRPRMAAAWLNLGGALRRVGQADEGLQALRQAVQLDPSLPEARYNLGLALLRLGDRPGAEEQYRALLILNPGLASGLGKFLGLSRR